MLASLHAFWVVMAFVALLLAGPGSAWAAGWDVAAADAVAVLDETLALAMRVVAEAQDWVVASYHRRPSVMIALAGVVLLPALAIIGRGVHRRRPQATRRVVPDDVPSAAFVEIEGIGHFIMPLGRDILQIGRQDDNDICLPDAAVHRYHAVIGRTLDSGFTITDVSGRGSSGLRVNGKRRRTSMLADGDMVEVGRTRMRFATAA